MEAEAEVGVGTGAFVGNNHGTTNCSNDVAEAEVGTEVGVFVDNNDGRTNQCK